MGVASSLGIGPNAEDLGQYLALPAQFFPQSGVELQIAHGSAVKAIREVADQERVDLIVMATHGRVGLDRLAHGSTAYRVVHGTSVPVLLLHGSTAVGEVKTEPA